MRKLLLSASVLALLATPALAQGRGQPPGQMDQAQREQAAREIMTDAMRRQNQGQNQGQPPAQNQRPDMRPGQRPDQRPGANNQARPGRPDMRNDNRGGNWNNNRGPRRDHSGFRDYHRAYNAPRRYRVAPYRRPSGWYARRWTFGEFLPAAFWAASYWLNDFNRYDLPPPPYGTVWVRYGDDALLIDRDTGEVISVRYGMFY